MNPSSESRTGTGRKKSTDSKSGVISARLFPPDADTLKGYGDTSITLTLLAQGLRLGEGNLPGLTDDEIECLQFYFHGLLTDIISIRMLRQTLADLDHAGSGTLCEKLKNLGDFELLALVLRHVNLRDIQIARGSI